MDHLAMATSIQEDNLQTSCRSSQRLLEPYIPHQFTLQNNFLDLKDRPLTQRIQKHSIDAVVKSGRRLTLPYLTIAHSFNSPSQPQIE